MTITDYRAIQVAGRTAEQEDALKRYVGCNAKFVRSTTVVTGFIRNLTCDYINIGGLIISLEKNDCLFWDQNGPQPKEKFTSEVQEFAKVLYSARRELDGGLLWSELSPPMKDIWCGVAKEGLRWVDGAEGCRGEGRV